MKVTALLLAAAGAAALAAPLDMDVPPFTRYLSVSDPLLTGNDVAILQNLLRNPPLSSTITADGQYGEATATAVRAFQTGIGLSADGIVGPNTAKGVLNSQSDDQYVPGNFTAASMGYKYKISIPVHRNRSIETVATLYDAGNAVLLNFTVRTHGHDASGPNTWPTFNSAGDGLNQFTTDGNTPTGLFEGDLNSPEDEPKFYGPYPVNRVVSGLKGNGAWLVPHIRYGVLIHTGEWAQYSPWHVPLPMPNSDGCIHTYPDNVKAIWQALVSQCGVTVNNNPGGSQPYPYKPQGLIEVYRVD